MGSEMCIRDRSTLVSMLSGRVTPSAGSVHFDNVDITRLPAHKRVALGMAYTFQITSVFANLTCYENVELAAQRSLTLPDAKASFNAANLKDATLASLERVGLADYHNATARHLAYGHQRLLEVAMGLALKPRLLMLDEPTQGLADTEIDNFIGVIRNVAEASTILLIEHNMRVVMELAEQITVLDSGRVLATGTPSEIQANADVQLAYLGA